MASHSARSAEVALLELPSYSRGTAAGGTICSTTVAGTTGTGLTGGAGAAGGTG